MKWPVALLLVALPLGGCGGSAVPPQGMSAPLSGGSVSVAAPASKRQNVYWTLGSSEHSPQVQFAKVPLQEYSRTTDIFNTSGNKLLVTTGMRLDGSGRLWIMSYGNDNDRDNPVGVFDLPLTQSSDPVHEFVLGGTYGATNLAFDASGNLWVTSRYNNSVLEYKAPFNKSGTISPKLKLTKGVREPLGIAFDAKGNLYVSNFDSGGLQSIAVFKAPIKNERPYFLNGLYTPGGLLFDKKGNLYGSTNGPSGSAIVRYDHTDLYSGARPSIYDGSGLYHPFGANFAFTADGDLYVSNCGVDASILVYPTSTKPFSSRLKPSLDFTDYELYDGCAWGLVIK